MEKLKVIKIGGHVIDDDDQLRSFLNAFSALPGAKILVHGGGKTASQMLEKLGVKPKMAGGRRITDAETLSVVQMVYAGLINKNITALLQAAGCPAAGLTGADADTIRAVKRPVRDIDYGFAGDITKVNTENIDILLKNGFIPVFCALTHDGSGQILNTNADTIAAELASALSERYETELVFCFEKKGVLLDVNDDESVIPHITEESCIKLKSEKKLKDGLLPKIDNAFQALQRGVQQVLITHISALSDSDDTGIQSGTRITIK
jgi:acetylglutamate kinase